MSIRIIGGDCRDTLRTLPDESVHCCVTSPPYFGLRDYGNAAQIGLEPTPDEYVAQMVAVFREVRRVLRDDGTLWLNLGSSYMSNTAIGPQGQTGQRAGRAFTASGLGAGALRDRHPNQSHLPKHVPACGTCGTALPDSTGADSACSGLCDGCLADFLSHRERIAGTGQQSEQCAPLPSPTNRDSERLGCEPEIPAASLHGAQESTTLESWRQRRGACSRCDARASSLSMLPPSLLGARESVRSSWLNYTTRFKPKDMIPIPWMVAMALQSDGWYLRQDVIWSKPNAMPESVRDRCTKAHEYVFLLSKSERYFYDAAAICEPATGLPAGNKAMAVREDANVNPSFAFAGSDTRNKRSVWTIATQPFSEAHFATMAPELAETCIRAGCHEGGTVLDPFGGAGTTGLVADQLQRNAVLCELNHDYIAIARRRIAADSSLFSEVVNG